MPDRLTRLTALGINRIAFVGKGDNPAAEIVLFKADPSETWTDLVLKRAFTQAKRVELAKAGAAIPVKNDSGEIVDGRYPIENVADLKNAMRAIGRVAEGDRAAVVAHIKKRARALGATDQLSDTFKEEPVDKAKQVTPGRWKRMLGIRDELNTLIDETADDRKEDAVSDAAKELIEALPEDKRDDVRKFIEDAEKRATEAEEKLEKSTPTPGTPPPAPAPTPPSPEPTPAEQLAKALEGQPEAVRKAFEDMRTATEKAEADAKEAREAVEKAAEDERLRLAKEKVASLKNLSVDTEKLGPVIAGVRKHDPEAAAEIERVLDSANAAASGFLTGEVGKEGQESEPEHKLHEMTKARATADGISEAEAFVQVMETDEGKALHAETVKEANAR